MRTTINGLTIEGTPEEMYALANCATAVNEVVRIDAKEFDKAVKEIKRKKIDWPKAEALRKAGWKAKAIAEEIGATEASVYTYFSKKGKE